MNDHVPLSQRIKEAVQQGLLDKLGAEKASQWISEALELENSARQVPDVKKWLMRADTEWRKRKSVFQAEDVMKELKWSGLNSLGVVKAALYEMCTEGHVVMMDQGTPAVYSYTYING